ncbi:MAG: ribosome silencing factor, partial [Chloroflexota bacterium]|nr:ribosome silencing factor [Chloroflexota bacterium]
PTRHTRPGHAARAARRRAPRGGHPIEAQDLTAAASPAKIASGHVTETVLALAADDPSLTESRSLALQIADVIADSPATDTKVLDIHAQTTIADFFVICSGENERQLRAINRDVLERIAEQGIRPRRVEGDPFAGWIVLDYNGVIVHVFDAEQRSFYRLEDMWSAAETLLSMP